MRQFTAVFYGFVLLTLAGCNSSGPSPSNPPGPPIPEQIGLLSPVSDVAAFEVALKASFTNLSAPEVITLAGAPADANFTGTYTQELNVDELDAVRYDGEHMFVAPRRYVQCCFLQTDALGISDDSSTAPERSIRILSTDPDNGAADLVSTIPLEDDISVQGMYLEGGKMFAMTSQMVYGSYGNQWANLAVWAPEKLGFQIYDVSNSSNPQLEIEASIDGVFVESRRIGNTVYIVSRYTPQVEGLNYYVETAEQQAANQALLADITIDELMPKITIAGETRPLVEPENCYTTTDDDTSDYAVITSVTAISIDDPNNFTTTCYNESAYGIYVSENALYLAEYRTNAVTQGSMTRIHKFALASTNIQYRGSADIEGDVWRGGQADFRMSEHDGDLRLIASQFGSMSDDFVDHKLYILRESSTGPDLEIISTLPNDTRPEEIGKPNESLYGVRFLGDVAYAVTFERIDPLYAIDLSNPADPFLAGELVVTGFSDLLHPVNDDLLLGLGRDATGGIKLELFDVSNISQPLSRGSATLGGLGSYSEANYDRHAFTYQADINGLDRFTIPAHVYSPDGSYQFLGAALYLFEILDKDVPELAMLNSLGSVQPQAIDPAQPEWVERSRSFIHDDTIYYIRNEEVWAAQWYAPSIVNGPF